MKNVIITCSDSKYFTLLESLILSVINHCKNNDTDICVLDLGLLDEQRNWLQKLNIKIEDAHLLASGLGYQLKTPIELNVCLRTSLPKILPGYHIYLWMDADTWVQDPGALDHYFLAAEKSGVVASVILDRTYNFCKMPNERWKKIYNWYVNGGFRDEVARKMSTVPVINAGVVAARANSTLWNKWPEVTWKIIDNQKDYYPADQTALNYLIYNKKSITSLILPAEYNWLCAFSLPVFDANNYKFYTPEPPFSYIKIMHLAGLKGQFNKVNLRLLDGRIAETSLLYPDRANQAKKSINS
jgi:lipopolysaccharide biosynthesis glycosyltransferase